MKLKPGTTVKGHVLLKIGHRRFLVSSKSKALAVMDALMDAPEVDWDYDGEKEHYTLKAPAKIEMEVTGTIKFLAASPKAEPPAPPKPAPRAEPAPPKPAPQNPAPKREAEPQMVDLRPVSKKTARAQLALIASSLNPKPAPERPQLANGQFELVPEAMRLGNGNVIALPDRRQHQDDLFRLEAGGGR